MSASSPLRPGCAGRRGFLLPWALLLLVVVGASAALVVTRVTTMRQSAATDEADVQAVLSADGAIATARTKLASDADWAGGGVQVGPHLVRTSVVRTDRGFLVTARAGGSVVVEAELVDAADRVLAVASWRRVR